MDSIDLRSDTVSWPTPEMRQAMANAPVGDDVYGEDPTINRLQDLAAERLGKEAALFVSSGTQGNILAVLTHCTRGSEVIIGREAHVFRREVGGAAALGGIQLNTVPVQHDGTLGLADIEHEIRDTHDVHNPLTRLVCLENTQGSCAGAPLSAGYTRSVRALCDRYGLALHIDGARLFNAAAALNVSAAELVAPADSISICLSKGLCAPVGSLLVGSREFIARARRNRKMLGGGMRQAGILAAAGLIALEKMTLRLADDHATARQLAEGIRQMSGLRLSYEPVLTNMVFFELDESVALNATQFAEALARDYNVRIGPAGARSFRAVTHYWITPEAIETALTGMRHILESTRQPA